jgi:hypothetical protein
MHEAAGQRDVISAATAGVSARPKSGRGSQAQVACRSPVGTTGRVMAAVLVCILLTNSAL